MTCNDDDDDDDDCDDDVDANYDDDDGSCQNIDGGSNFVLGVTMWHTMNQREVGLLMIRCSQQAATHCMTARFHMRTYDSTIDYYYYYLRVVVIIELPRY